MEENAEHSLIERAKQGQAAAIAELYGRYWRAARAAAYGVTADMSLAEDAAAEALYAAIGSLQDLKDVQRFGPWLRTIVIRTANRLKAAHSKEKGFELPPEAPSLAPNDSLEQQELAALIYEAIGTLSETLREAMFLFYFEGYSLKDAAGFLDIPEGTLKRRLHDGCQHLKNAAEQIIKGAKPMNTKRQQILQQLKEASKGGIHSEAFFQAARQALRLRPVPNDLLKEIMLKHWAAKKEKLSKPLSEEKERQIHESMIRLFAPSGNVKDPNHPVGMVANAIRAALPEFQQWQLDWSCVDIYKMLRDLSEGKEKALSFLQPPGFTEISEGSYISAKREWLVQDEDGSVCTGYELMQKKKSMEDMKTQIHQGKRLSDTLSLLWKKSESLELRAVEDLLRRLSNAIVPNTTVFINSCNEHHYRVALRMHLGDNPIPGAIGGVLASSLGLPDSFKVAAVTIYLEPWAQALSGQPIELTKDFSIMSFRT